MGLKAFALLFGLIYGTMVATRSGGHAGQNLAASDGDLAENPAGNGEWMNS